MTDTTEEATGEQCGVCGARIDAGEGHIIYEGDEPIAYAHTTCA